MANETVTVWVATDADSATYVYTHRPDFNGDEWEHSNGHVMYFSGPCGISVPPGECREYVLVPADQYRQPSAELSPVAKLIAEMAHSAGIALAQLGIPHTAETLAQLAARQVKAAIDAAREIESEAK